VLVTIDTLRADHLGCYGAEPTVTPTLDALAARGARFETAVSPAPLTLPSHATLLTGLDPPRHGVRANGAYQLGPEWPTLAEQLAAGGLPGAAFVSAFVLERRFGLARGFDHYDDAVGVQLDDIGVGSRPATATVDAALAWLAEAPARFFLWVHLYDPHAPYQPPEPHLGRHPGNPYAGEIAYADAELGRLLEAIDRRFPDGRTLVAVTADHGESLGEHGEPTHAFGVYDATQRVPLVLAGPGVPEGRVVAPLVRLADVAPTLLELFALPVPADRSGASVVPLLRDEGEPAERVAWVETLATQLDMGWSPLLGVRTARHKYVRAPRPELYDLARDPKETTNLADASPALVAELDGLVAERVAGQRATPNRGVDKETADQLAALGYLTSGPPVAGASALGVVGGVDPKDRMGDLETLRDALTLLKQRRGPEAMERFAALRSSGFEIDVLRGEAALLAGQLDAARAAALRARQHDAERASAIVLLGRIEEAAGQDESASARFHEALTRDPESSAALLGLGRLAEAAGELDTARSFYERARTRKRVEAEALWRLGALAIERGDATAARSILAELPQRFARSPDAAARLARAEQRAGRLDLARLRVRGALQQYPDAIELRELEEALTEGAPSVPVP
jgi:tetratricopeptide (TPR) repeat protein